MKKSHMFLIWLVYIVMVGVAFDVMDLLIERNLLSRWCVFFIGFMFMFLGWVGARLEIKMSKNKKEQNNIT